MILCCADSGSPPSIARRSQRESCDGHGQRVTMRRTDHATHQTNARAALAASAWPRIARECCFRLERLVQPFRTGTAPSLMRPLVHGRLVTAACFCMAIARRMKWESGNRCCGMMTWSSTVGRISVSGRWSVRSSLAAAVLCLPSSHTPRLMRSWGVIFQFHESRMCWPSNAACGNLPVPQ